MMKPNPKINEIGHRPYTVREHIPQTATTANMTNIQAWDHIAIREAGSNGSTAIPPNLICTFARTHSTELKIQKEK